MTPTIKGLAVTQEWSGTSWQATGDVDGIGWLTAWGDSLVAAMEALQAMAAERVAEAAEGPEADAASSGGYPD